MASRSQVEKRTQRERVEIAEDCRKVVEVLKWASEPVPLGHERYARIIPYPDQPHRPGIPVQVEVINLADALFFFGLDRHPEWWPGGATFPVHDEQYTLKDAWS